MSEQQAWRDTAAQYARNADFYRGLLDRCALALGPAAFTSDDGSVQDEPVRLNIPGLVERLAADKGRGEVVETAEAAIDRRARGAHLRALHDDCDAAIDAAYTLQQRGGDEFRGDAINWGDLACVEASAAIDDQGHEFLRVVIEEADEKCPALRRLVADALREKWGEVDVRTEW